MGRPFTVGRALLCATAFIISGTASAAPKSPRLQTYGKFTPGAAKKAQAYVTTAMTVPMADMLSQASELKAEAMLTYGLGLELGRAPATRDMSANERSRVQAVFKEMLILYVRAKDDINLRGDEAILLDQPDFWILMARSLSFKERPPSLYLDNPDGSGTVITTDANIITASDGKQYSLVGQPLLDAGRVSAAQSCIIYARAEARMQKVQIVDASAAPHLTAEKLAEYKQSAKALGANARRFGTDACGSSNYYKAVRAYASLNLGKLGLLTDDPSALVGLSPDSE
ncbi:hypothetical protein [Asticcacaulis machinosus]|uniref:Uncharacterized protein n=1 Tax=Asticcacaulis machinosus TaxID=2984211 RepID=A0ABT5HMQ9_9CAUL|nr:hypothetical protein [Asticcacaulis machinosus]MDC7676884.1 hypothetical protein [Asticcacaulis machinosus]